MKCINCGYELPEGARYCGNCGQEQPQYQLVQQQMGQRYCPHCGSANDGDAVYCTSCGRNMNEDEEAYTVRKTPKKLIIGIVSVLIVAVAIGGAVKIIGGMGSNKTDFYITYVKEGYVNQGDMEHYKKKTVEYDGRYASDKEERENYYAGVSYSKDGKYICYPTDLEHNDETEFRLNMQKVGKTDESVKIDNSVTIYKLLDNNKVLYIKAGNNAFYINDWKGNKEKIASDVYNFCVDDKQQNVVWGEENGDGTINVYQQDLALKKEKNTLAKDVESFAASSDLKYIAIKAEDVLYIVENFGEKQKISSGVQRADYSDLDNGGIYYTKKSEETLSAEEAIEDNCAYSDSVLQKPNPKYYQVEKIEKNSWTGKYEKVQTLDEDAYNEAIEKYRAKENRDEIREALENHELSVPIEKLYYVKDGKETQIDTTLTQIEYSTKEWQGIIYNRYNMEEVPKLNISDIEDADSIDSAYYQLLSEYMQTCIYSSKSKSIVLDEAFIAVWGVDVDSKTGYGIKSQDEDAYDDDEIPGILYSFSVENNSDGKCEMISENVEHRQKVLKNGDIYYLKDKDSDGNCDLYCNDKMIDSDVRTLSDIPDSNNILYKVDYNSSNGSATLKMYDGKKDKTIADDVYYYLSVDEKHIALLTDYSKKSYCGDLKYYLGKEELKSIDEDVSFIFGTTNFY